MDILPTIADHLDMTLPIDCDGQSVLDPDRVDRPHKKFFDGTGLAVAEADFHTRFLDLQAARQRLPFRPGDWDSVFRVGPHTELLGRTAAELAVAGQSSVQIIVTSRQGPYSDSTEDLVPCFIEGRVQPPPAAGQPVHLAIAVNGTVQAVTRTYQMPGLEDAWSAMVPEDALRIGDNALRVFELRVTDGTPTVWACDVHLRPR